jgi:DNA-binding transcriptional MerR regulator
VVEGSLLSVGEFAKLTRTTQATLHHYDKIGLISPTERGESNGYRYYSFRQLALVNVIRTMQALGLSLAEINGMMHNRTPEETDALFLRQIGTIEEKIDEWVEARKLLVTLRQSIHSVLDTEEGSLTIKLLPAEAIVLGDLNDLSGDRGSYDALSDFYRTIQKKYPDLNLNYPVWGLFSEERILREDWIGPDRYYFYNPAGYDKRPAALYAVGYTRGGYGQTEGLYRKLIKYIDDNGFEISGNTYEEYPLNEICTADDQNYLIRILITVRERN